MNDLTPTARLSSELTLDWQPMINDLGFEALLPGARAVVESYVQFGNTCWQARVIRRDTSAIERSGGWSGPYGAMRAAENLLSLGHGK